MASRNGSYRLVEASAFSTGQGPMQQELAAILQGRMAASLVRRDVAKLAGSVALTAAGVFAVFRFLVGYGYVKGSSMEPSLCEGDWYFMRRVGDVARGDIVVLRSPDDVDVVKRVVGLPGEKVGIHFLESEVEVDGADLPEPYAYGATRPKSDMEYPVRLGEGEYFVLGDNRENSLDSRDYGPVRREQIEGIVVAVLRLG